ncbi:unnamed protein product [Tenebrio molitor]|nr:unnamed protein product [Tenebrio molitor]
MSQLRKRKTSEMWQFFEPINQLYAQCNICKANISHKTSISNLQSHMQNKFNILQCLFQQPASERTISKVEENSKAHKEAILQEDAVIPSTSAESPQLQMSQKPSKSRWYNQLSLLFILDFQPFRVVEDTGFQQFVSALNPAYALPSRHTKSKTITAAMYEECLHKMKEIVETGRKFCVTTDCWTSINTTILHSLSCYIGVTAHFLNDNFEIHSIFLECWAMHVSHTSENMAAEWHRIGELKKKSCSRNQTMHIIFKMHFRYN